MAKINFYIRSKQEGQPATVYLRYNDGHGVDFWIITPEKIFPEHWSNKARAFKQRIIYTDSFNEKKKNEIELRFNNLKQHLSNERLRLKSEVSKEWLKINIDKYYNRTVGDEILNSYIERFITEITSGKRLNKGKIYIPSTIKNYKGFQAQFNEFQGIYTQERLNELKEEDKTIRPLKMLSFEDITIDFYKDFVRFFKDKNYSPNTIGRHIKHLKVLMRQSMDEGLHKNTEFQRHSFEAMAVPVDNVYLNEDELKSLFELDLTEHRHLEVARDVFLCGCFTAQRYSDYSRFSNNNIKSYSGNKVIEIIQQKTGEKCIIPIRPELKYILKKYNYNLPLTHEQKVNKYIKTVVEMAKINDMVQYEENRGGLKIKKNVAKCDLIKTHTARRSGCTNMYLAGIPVIDIMKVSGHKTEREFLKYIKVTKEQTAVNLASHPYFLGNTLKVAK
jgi:site-specific recombinase XerD